MVCCGTTIFDLKCVARNDYYASVIDECGRSEKFVLLSDLVMCIGPANAFARKWSVISSRIVPNAFY